ncbi:MAG TPA: thiamine pyrophosphate-dependent enzyme, partial [Burkholderiales bacterium]
YRPIAEREAWEKLDPVECFYKVIAKTGLISDPARKRMEQEIQEEIQEAFEHALASADPTEEDLYRHVYAVG